MWDEITYSIPNFNVCSVKVWELINMFIPRVIMDVTSYPHWDKVKPHFNLVKGSQVALNRKYLISAVNNPDSKIHVDNMEPTWFLSTPDGWSNESCYSATSILYDWTGTWSLQHWVCNRCNNYTVGNYENNDHYMMPDMHLRFVRKQSMLNWHYADNLMQVCCSRCPKA